MLTSTHADHFTEASAQTLSDTYSKNIFHGPKKVENLVVNWPAEPGNAAVAASYDYDGTAVETMFQWKVLKLHGHVAVCSGIPVLIRFCPH